MNASMISNITAFQLYLLKTMDPPERLLTSSLLKLNRTSHDLVTAYETISPLQKIQPSQGKNIMEHLSEQARKLRELLSEAFVHNAVQGSGGLFTYRLLLWPAYNFSVEYDPTWGHITKAEFTRDSGRPEEIVFGPWGFLTEDLRQNFDEVQEIDSWGHYDTYTGRRIDRGGRYFLRFGWGLLQEISKM